MSEKKKGRQSFDFDTPVSILSSFTIAGHIEGQGPLTAYFDLVVSDELWGEKSPEKAEAKMMLTACLNAVDKSGLTLEDIDFFLAGDLLNQIISANYTARTLFRPFLGLYGACSSSVESLLTGSFIIDGGFADHVLVATSSHYQTAERQYRLPVEMNGQLKTTAQTTVTGAGSVVLGCQHETRPKLVITRGTVGKVIDLGVKDVNNMGAAMAPAAADTIRAHFSDFSLPIDYYDLVVTGDLASVGKSINESLLKRFGLQFGERYTDCGMLIFSEDQNIGAGGSGCGCSTVVSYGYLFQKLLRGDLDRILLVATGALMSPVALQQGESIPCIAHAVAIERVE